MWYGYDYGKDDNGNVYCQSDTTTDVNTGDDIQSEIDAKTAERNRKQAELDGLNNI